MELSQWLSSAEEEVLLDWTKCEQQQKSNEIQSLEKKFQSIVLGWDKE